MTKKVAAVKVRAVEGRRSTSARRSVKAISPNAAAAGAMKVTTANAGAPKEKALAVSAKVHEKAMREEQEENAKEMIVVNVNRSAGKAIVKNL